MMPPKTRQLKLSWNSQYPEVQGPAIPETGQMDKSKTPQAGAKDSHACKRKRCAAFAQRPRARAAMYRSL